MSYWEQPEKKDSSLVKRLVHYGLDKVLREREAVVWIDEKCKEKDRISFGQLYIDGCCIANTMLNKWGCKRGDHVLLVFYPGIDFMVSFVGCLLAGLVAVPISPPDVRHPKVDMEYLLRVVEDTDAKVCVTHKPFLHAKRIQLSGPKYPKSLKFHSMTFVRNSSEMPLKEDFDPSTVLETKEDDIAFIQYTNGMTKDPKGVMITFDNLNRNLFSMEQQMNTSSKRTLLVSWVPSYSDSGLVGAILHGFYVGFRQISMSPNSFLKFPNIWMYCVSKYRATMTIAPNFAYEICANQTLTREELKGLDLSPCKRLLICGEPVQASTIHKFVEKFKSCGVRMGNMDPSYVVTENVLLVSCRPGLKPQYPIIINVSEESLKIGTRVKITSNEKDLQIVGNGQPGEGTIVTAVNPDTGRLLRNGYVGELWISGQSKALGYKNQPKLTNETFQAMTTTNQYIHWYRTGDVGFILEDQIFICGRMDEMIELNNKNIFVQNMEQTILGMISIEHGNVICFSIVNENEDIKVVILIELQHTKNNNNTKNQLHKEGITIKNMIKNRYGGEDFLCELCFVDAQSIPKTLSGRPRKYECKQLYKKNKLKMTYRLGDKNDSITFMKKEREGAQQQQQQQQPQNTVIQDEKDIIIVEEEDIPFFEDITCTGAEQWLRDYIAEMLHTNNEVIRMETDLFELGLTSISTIALTETLHKMTGERKHIPIESFFNKYRSIRQILSGVAEIENETIKRKDVPITLPELNFKRSMIFPTFVKTLLQFGGICLIWFFLCISLLAPFYFLSLFIKEDYWFSLGFLSNINDAPTNDLIVVSLVIPLAFPIWQISFSLLVILSKWIVIGRYNGNCEISMNSFAFLRWWFVDRLVLTWEQLCGTFILDTPLMNIYFKMMGADVSMDSKISTFFREFDLVYVGKQTKIMGKLIPRMFDAKKQTLRFRPIAIFPYSAIGIESKVMGGSLVARQTQVTHLGVLREGAQTTEALIYEGNPAKQIGVLKKKTKARKSIIVSHPQIFCELLGKLVAMLFTLYLFVGLSVPSIYIYYNYIPTDIRTLRYAFLGFVCFAHFQTGLIITFISILIKRLLGLVNTSLTRFVVDYQYRISYLLFGQFFSQTTIINWIPRLYGAKIGSGVLFSSIGSTLKPSMMSKLSVGRDAFIANTAFIGKKYQVGSFAEIGMNTVISGIVDRGAVVFPLTFYRNQESIVDDKISIVVDPQTKKHKDKYDEKELYAFFEGWESDPTMCTKIFGQLNLELEDDFIDSIFGTLLVEPMNLEAEIKQMIHLFGKSIPFRNFILHLQNQYPVPTEFFMNFIRTTLHYMIVLDRLTIGLMKKENQNILDEEIFPDILDRLNHNSLFNSAVSNVLGLCVLFDQQDGSTDKHANGHRILLETDIEMKIVEQLRNSRLGELDRLNAQIGLALRNQCQQFNIIDKKGILVDQNFCDAFSAWYFCFVVSKYENNIDALALHISSMLLPKSILTNKPQNFNRARVISMLLVSTTGSQQRENLKKRKNHKNRTDPYLIAPLIESTTKFITEKWFFGGEKPFPAIQDNVSKLGMTENTIKSFNWTKEGALEVVRLLQTKHPLRTVQVVHKRGWVCGEVPYVLVRVIIFIIFWACLIPAFEYMQFILSITKNTQQHQIFKQILLLFPAIPLSMFSIATFVLLFSWILFGLVPQSWVSNGMYRTIKNMIAINENFLLPITHGTLFYNFWAKLNGAKVGKGAFLYSSNIRDLKLLSFENYSIVDEQGWITGHAFLKGSIRFAPVKIGKHALIENGAMVLSKMHVPDYTSLYPNQIAKYELTNLNATKLRLKSMVA